jgi:hypothetical protein
MSAQTPTAAVNDYLSEVRIFANGSPDFAKIASSLGVDAALATLPGASLVAAVRNDSGQAIELRTLFQLTKDGKTTPRDMSLGPSLQAGESALVAPREIRGALTRLMLRPGFQGLVSGSPRPQPLDAYQGATVVVSIDSATLADGKFIGADTQNIYSRLVAEDAAKKSFFSDVAGFQSAGLSQTQIEQALTTRKGTADAAKSQMTGGITGLNLAAITESGLCNMALMRLQHFGLANLFEYAAKKNAAAAAKPSIHR